MFHFCTCNTLVMVDVWCAVGSYMYLSCIKSSEEVTVNEGKPTHHHGRGLVPHSGLPFFKYFKKSWPFWDKLSWIHTIWGLERRLDVTNFLIFIHSSVTSISLETQPKENRVPHGSVFQDQCLFPMATFVYLLPCTGFSLPLILFTHLQKTCEAASQLQEDEDVILLTTHSFLTSFCCFSKYIARWKESHT